MIKAIIFDCFGVLTDDMWRNFRLSLPNAESLRAQKLNHQYDAGEITRDEFLSGVAEITGYKPQQIAAVIDSETAKNLPLLNYIAALKKKYKIGLLSNVADNWITKEFLTPDEQKLFDTMVFSFEAGTTKPDPLIFQSILEKLDVKTDEAVMIDDIESYCQAAQNLGMNAIVYKDFGQMKTELENLLTDSNN